MTWRRGRQWRRRTGRPSPRRRAPTAAAVTTTVSARRRTYGQLEHDRQPGRREQRRGDDGVDAARPQRDRRRFGHDGGDDRRRPSTPARRWWRRARASCTRITPSSAIASRYGPARRARSAYSSPNARRQVDGASTAPTSGDAEADGGRERDGDLGRVGSAAAGRRHQHERDRCRGEEGGAAERRQHAERGGVVGVEHAVGDEQVGRLQHGDRDERQRHGQRAA